jgi:hypothetical protein
VSILLQDILVTMMALMAALIIIRRLVGTFRPGKANPACDNCASGAAACEKAAAEQSSDKAIPLVLHRR